MSGGGRRFAVLLRTFFPVERQKYREKLNGISVYAHTLAEILAIVRLPSADPRRKNGNGALESKKAVPFWEYHVKFAH